MLGRMYKKKMYIFVSMFARNVKMLANLKHDGCYLNLGCGPKADPQFCNLDYTWYPGVDVCWDAAKQLPFGDRYVSGIFCEHMIEHLPFHAAISLLAECKRILKPGAVFRIVMPDGELYLSEYAKQRCGQPSAMPYAEKDEPRFGYQTPLISINRIFRDHGHKFIWDYETLRIALERCGFTGITRREFGGGGDPKLLRDSPDRKIESFYVEASYA
jgi:predicted SAM-dependent methyltransferase